MIQAEVIYQTIKREFAEYLENADFYNLFYDTLQEAVRTVIYDIKLFFQVAQKEIKSGDWKIVLGDDIVEIGEVLWRPNDKEEWERLQPDDFTTILQSSKDKGNPRYYGILLEGGTAYLLLSPPPEKDSSLMITYKQWSMDIIRPDPTRTYSCLINLPLFLLKAIEYYCLKKFAYYFNPQKEAEYFQRYLLEIQIINSRYASPVKFVGRKQRTIFWQRL
jgi:hypothetical protein